jgi:hypothetical protein
MKVRPNQRGNWVGLITLLLWLAACSPAEVPVRGQGVPTLSGVFVKPTSLPTRTLQPKPTATQPATTTPTLELTSEVLIASTGDIQLTVDGMAPGQPISPYIYGMNWADETLAQELGLTVNRWGGNATTRYNWQNDTGNLAADWFFENVPNTNVDPKKLPEGSTADQFVEQNLAAGVDTILTIPLIGWTPKSRALACGFSVKKYGEQQDTDSTHPDCGNGVLLNGELVTGNNPADTSLQIDEKFIQLWLGHLAKNYGLAGAGGVRFYNLDNEPMLWHVTQRDVHPNPVSYDEIRDRTYQYAPAIKAVDPDAQTLGPTVWGWTAYFYSALDAQGPSYFQSPSDQNAHGGLDFVAWYLGQMKAYEDQHRERILDYLDLHYYPQADQVALKPAGDEATQELRLRSTRSLWDPQYQDESWIKEPVMLIPRMKGWVDEYYPGTKLAISEYNFGGLEDINGALAQAEVLGIFGREGLDLATLWSPPALLDPGAFAFRMYRNYDGQGSTFGDVSLPAASPDPDRVSIFAARRTTDGALTLMVINKTHDLLPATIQLSGLTTALSGEVYRYSAAHLDQIERLPDAGIDGTGLSADFEPASITLFVLKTP